VFDFSVNLGELRTVQIFVVGEVVKPGTYTVSSLATAINALMTTGGPTKRGSLRNVKVMRQGRVVRMLDLYAYLLAGDDSQDQRLRSGDTIFVPPIGPVAAIAGSVRRPGIYELSGSTKLADLVQVAGGLTPAAYPQQVQIERVLAYQGRSILDVDFSTYVEKGDAGANVALQDGDFVMIFSVPARVPERVTLEGFVKYPGRYELKSGMRLSHILTSQQLLPEAHRGRIEVVRVRQDFSTEVVAVDAERLLRGDASQDLSLRRLDRIIVNSEVRQPESATLKGEVRRPGVYPIAKGERLSAVLRRAGGFTDRAFLRGAVFTRESTRKIERAKLDEFIISQEQRLLVEASTVVVAGVDRDELAVQERSLKQQRELLQTLADKVTLGRVVLRLDELERFEGSEADIPLEDGDALVIPSPPSSVLVLGSVRMPTSILSKPGEGVDYYLDRAGRLTPEADQKEMYIVKADGSALSGFPRLQQVEAGDTIVVPPKTQVVVRPFSIFRDIITVLGQTAITAAALAILF
jgi:protein involved in polysaccharide export with SLBB domain